MNAKVKKLVKIVLWTVGIIILIPIMLIATLPLWLGPIVRPSVNAIAPQFTKTAFNIDKLHLNPYTCNFELGGVTIGNPEGFSETNAVRLGYFNVNVDTGSLSSDVIVIENVEISDIYVTLLKNADGKTNIDIIRENVIGAEDEVKAQEEAARKEREEAERKAGMTEEQIKAEEEAAKFDKKIIVNRFVFKNVSGKIALSQSLVVPFKVPSIELKDIGKDSGGYDVEHLVAAIIKEFWASVMASAVELTGALGDGAKALGGLLGSGAGKAGDALGSGAKAAGDALGSGAKAAGDALGDGAKAVGEGAGKAVDALKGLFN